MNFQFSKDLLSRNFINKIKTSNNSVLPIFVFGVLFVLCGLVSAHAQVTCNKFDVKAVLVDSGLQIWLDTDLPDETKIMVWVYREYKEKGSDSIYVVDYFSEKSTVKKTKTKHKVSIASDGWKRSLRENQEELSRVGLGFEVGWISDKIVVRMSVPVNQSDPRFGDWNSKLTGKMVSSGVRTVEDKVVIHYPLDSQSKVKAKIVSLDPMALEKGRVYSVSKQTPLMPSHSPADPLEALTQVKIIPEGGAFKVLGKVLKGGEPWYRVVAFDRSFTQIGVGWINSTALVGQKLRAVE